MKQILTVDDSASIRQMVNFTLTKAGYVVAEAVDGKDGLEKTKRQKFDLIKATSSVFGVHGGYEFQPRRISDPWNRISIR